MLIRLSDELDALFSAGCRVLLWGAPGVGKSTLAAEIGRAMERLLPKVPAGPWLLDPPGLVRGNAGSELLADLVQAARIDTVLALTRPGRCPELEPVLQILPVRLLEVDVSPQALHPSKLRDGTFKPTSTPDSATIPARHRHGHRICGKLPSLSWASPLTAAPARPRC